MKKTIIASLVLLASATSTSAFAGFTGEQVWNAAITNTQQTCGIDYANGTQTDAGILVAGETGSSGSKAIDFTVKANTANIDWKITETHLVENTGRFSFPDSMVGISDTSLTSVFVNDTEYAWANAAQDHVIPNNVKTIAIAPKINMDQADLPVGETKIQAKLVLTCSN